MRLHHRRSRRVRIDLGQWPRSQTSTLRHGQATHDRNDVLAPSWRASNRLRCDARRCDSDARCSSAKALPQYRRGARRSADWLKIKTPCRQEAVIVRFTAPRRSRPYFGALGLGGSRRRRLALCRPRRKRRLPRGPVAVEKTAASVGFVAIGLIGAVKIDEARVCGRFESPRPRGAFRSIGAQSTDTEGLPVNFLTVFCA
jgi:hypothetical protein